MIILNFINQQGFSDVSVTTKNKNTFVPALGWPDTNPAFALVDNRNVAFFPIRLRNNGTEPVIGPDINVNPELFIPASDSLGVPAIKNFVRFAVAKFNEVVIRETVTSVPFVGLLKNGVARLEPNETVYAYLNMGLMDKSGIFNRGMAEQYWVQAELDWEDKFPGWYCNIVVPARFYTGQIRHSEELNKL